MSILYKNVKFVLLTKTSIKFPRHTQFKPIMEFRQELFQIFTFVFRSFKLGKKNCKHFHGKDVWLKVTHTELVTPRQ